MAAIKAGATARRAAAKSSGRADAPKTITVDSSDSDSDNSRPPPPSQMPPPSGMRITSRIPAALSYERNLKMLLFDSRLKTEAESNDLLKYLLELRDIPNNLAASKYEYRKLAFVRVPPKFVNSNPIPYASGSWVRRDDPERASITIQMLGWSDGESLIGSTGDLQMILARKRRESPQWDDILQSKFKFYMSNLPRSSFRIEAIWALPSAERVFTIIVIHQYANLLGMERMAEGFSEIQAGVIPTTPATPYDIRGFISEPSKRHSSKGVVWTSPLIWRSEADLAKENKLDDDEGDADPNAVPSYLLEAAGLFEGTEDGSDEAPPGGEGEHVGGSSTDVPQTDTTVTDSSSSALPPTRAYIRNYPDSRVWRNTVVDFDEKQDVYFLNPQLDFKDLRGNPIEPQCLGLHFAKGAWAVGEVEPRLWDMTKYELGSDNQWKMRPGGNHFFTLRLHQLYVLKEPPVSSAVYMQDVDSSYWASGSSSADGASLDDVSRGRRKTRGNAKAGRARKRSMRILGHVDDKENEES